MKFLAIVIFAIALSVLVSVQNDNSHPTPADSSIALISITPCVIKYDIKGADPCLSWKSLPKSEVAMQEEFPFELMLTNLGKSVAENISINIWAQNIKLRAGPGDFSCRETSKGLDCEISKVVPQQWHTLTVVGSAFAAGKAVITAQLKADADQDLSNNEAKPYAQILVSSTPVSGNDDTSKFLELREGCVKQFGNDKAALRKCMISAQP